MFEAARDSGYNRTDNNYHTYTGRMEFLDRKCRRRECEAMLVGPENDTQVWQIRKMIGPVSAWGWEEQPECHSEGMIRKHTHLEPEYINPLDAEEWNEKYFAKDKPYRLVE